jgi:VIT1/CCC1 family predicted Fe2+/Mn2+ transporter
MRDHKRASFVRSFVFGVEDSLVSTVGLLSGIAAAGTDRSAIILTGVILIFVEAFSMGIGSFLAEQSSEEYVTGEKSDSSSLIVPGIIMFVSYFGSGFIPLAPYLFLDPRSAFGVSVGASLAALAILGTASAKIAGGRFLRSAVRMASLGGIAIAVGVVVGSWVR